VRAFAHRQKPYSSNGDGNVRSDEALRPVSDRQASEFARWRRACAGLLTVGGCRYKYSATSSQLPSRDLRRNGAVSSPPLTVATAKPRGGSISPRRRSGSATWLRRRSVSFSELTKTPFSLVSPRVCLGRKAESEEIMWLTVRRARAALLCLPAGRGTATYPT
jgi:hypothetical protein